MLLDFYLNKSKAPLNKNRHNIPRREVLGPYVKNKRKQDFYPCSEEPCNIKDLASATNEFLSCILFMEKNTAVVQGYGKKQQQFILNDTKRI